MFIAKTTAAILLAIVVANIVAWIVGVVAILFQYYILGVFGSPFAAYAAMFFGGIAGGYGGVAAARATNDYALRDYSLRGCAIALWVTAAVFAEIDMLTAHPPLLRQIIVCANLFATVIASSELFWRPQPPLTNRI